MRTSPGLFVVFDGGEGTGKSTALETTEEWLRREYTDVVRTREPGGTTLGRQLRSLLLDSQMELDEVEEALLFAADRSNHVRTILHPALERGAIIICDRYVTSTRAYQLSGKPSDEVVETLIALGTRRLMPHRTYLFDAPPEIGLARVGMRGELTSFDARSLAFHQGVRERLLTQARANPAAFRLIDATRPREEVAATIEADLRELIAHHFGRPLKLSSAPVVGKS